MLRTLLASRAFISILGAALAAAVVAAAGFVLLDPTKKMIGYCAMMPDAIGLYTGNEVTMRGIKVGTVTTVRPEGTGARVEFEVDAEHPLRGEATATTLATTIVADRKLAVLGVTGGADWDPRRCLTKTMTPKSLTQTLDAMSKIADQLQGGDDPAQRDRVRRAVTAFDQATAGTGTKLNDTITALASALRAPDAAIGHIGSLIDRLTELSASVANGWGDLREMLNGFAPILQLVNGVWDMVIEFVNSVVTILPWLNDITTEYGGPILQILDSSVSKLHLIGANVGTLQKLIDMIPAVTPAFRATTDPDTGRLAMTYAGPRVALDQPDADLVCGTINAAMPGRCTAANGLTTVDLVPLVLGMAGAR
ncbi:MlaD family protein [Nocardia uniformis]|nr:MlaD family protein [Nocardia uniformis]